LQRRLPDYMIPARFVAMERFPTTPTRKIDRNALPRPDTTVEAGAAYVAPRSAVEHVVAGIFAEILGLDRVGVDDNFFELGGHSLHATSILAKLAATFGVELELRPFFQQPTVAATAAALTVEAGPRLERIAQLRVELESMSPADVSALLAAKRAEQGARSA
jgi:acyl carrier protein